MKVFLTGGTGFIGGALAARLRERGDDVVALVRTPAPGARRPRSLKITTREGGRATFRERGGGRAAALTALGCRLVRGDLADVAAVRSGVEGADAVVHAAAMYEVGIPAARRPAMYDANVAGTRTVLTAAFEAGTPRVLYVSSVVAFGNTHGAVVDESHPHPGRYTSYYDETKHLAHEEARRLLAAGLPGVVVQPGAVYGPGDHSLIGDLVKRAARGRLPAMAFPGTGVNAVHRDDVVTGILLALDAGRAGESYVLGGEVTTVGAIVATAARLAGRRGPLVTVPGTFVKALAPLGPVVAPLLRLPRNVGEVVSSSDGVTYWATDAKARAELGYAPRALADGLRDTLRAEGLLRG